MSSYLSFNLGGYASMADADVSLAMNTTVSFWLRGRNSTLDNKISFFGSWTGDNYEDGWGISRDGNSIIAYYGEAAVAEFVTVSGSYNWNNRWTHVAVSLNESTGAITIYLDGELVETNANPGFLGGTSFSTYYMGGYLSVVDGPTAILDGDMDDIRIYNKVLSDNQIKAIYNNGIGVLNTDANFLAIAGTDNGLYANLDEGAGDNFSYRVSVGGMLQTKNTNDFEVVDPSINPNGVSWYSGGIPFGEFESYYQNKVVEKSPVIYYPFDEVDGNVAYNFMSNNYHGTYTNDYILGQPGLISNSDRTAVEFQGSNDYGLVNEYRVGTNWSVSDELTFEIWFRTNAGEMASGAALWGSFDTAADGGFTLHIADSGRLRFHGFYYYDGFPPFIKQFYIQTNFVLLDEVIYHVVVTIDDNDEIFLYINGDRVLDCLDMDGNPVESIVLPSHDIFQDKDFVIAASSSVGVGSFTDGVVDEFALYEESLSAEQIKENYDAAFYTGISRTEISAGSTTTVEESGEFVYTGDCGTSATITINGKSYTISNNSDCRMVWDNGGYFQHTFDTQNSLIGYSTIFHDGNNRIQIIWQGGSHNFDIRFLADAPRSTPRNLVSLNKCRLKITGANTDNSNSYSSTWLDRFYDSRIEEIERRSFVIKGPLVFRGEVTLRFDCDYPLNTYDAGFDFTGSRNAIIGNRANIYYTLNGKDPSSGAKVYHGPITVRYNTVGDNVVLKAQIHYNGQKSPVYEINFTIVDNL